MTATKKLSLDSIHRPLHSYGDVFFGILRTSAALESWPIDPDPDYQRGHVWTELQQMRFVGHLLEGGHVPPLVVNTGPLGDWPIAELVDGKQRVTACLRWERGEIGAELTDGRVVMADQLDATSRRKCVMSIGMRYGMTRLTRLDCLELYVRLNRGGTVHTDAEIERVRALLAAEKNNPPR